MELSLLKSTLLQTIFLAQATNSCHQKPVFVQIKMEQTLLAQPLLPVQKKAMTNDV